MQSKSAPPAEKLRNAGLLERFHITRCDGGFDGCLVASARYTSTASSVNFDRPTILRALKHVVLAHPVLCVQIAGNDVEGPYFVRLPSVDLDAVLHYHSYPGNTLEEVFAQELLTPQARHLPTPLWRVVVHDDNTVLFAWHHAIGDGSAAYALHHAFLSALNRANEAVGTDTPVVDVPTTLAVLPTIEQRTEVAVSWKTFFRTLFETFAPASWQPGYAAWTAHPVVSQRDLRVHVRLRLLPASDAKRLTALCREHGCTLTTFLHTLAVRVLSQLYRTCEDAHGAERYRTFSTTIPVSLRRFTGISPLEMGDHVSSYHSFPPIGTDETCIKSIDDFPWKTAAELKVSLQAGLADSRQVVGTVAYMYSLGISAGFFAGKMGKKRAGTFELSNIGSMPRGDAVPGLWEMDDVYFGQNDAVCGAAIKMNVAGSPSGAVNFAYTWGVGAVQAEFVDAFVKEMHGAIERIIML